MAKKAPQVSIVIVNYKVTHLIKNCIKSIYRNSSLPLEIIVVDNSSDQSLKTYIQKERKTIFYIDSRENIGFGAGNNLGAKKARGKYLLFLNPDTIITKGSIEKLVVFLESHKKVGIVSPLLVDEKGNINPLCGSDMSTPKSAFLLHSFLRKLFIKTKKVKTFFINDLASKEPIYKDAVQVAATLIPKKVFEKIDGFDERFFLFFEEYDIAQKLKKQNLKAVVLPTSKFIHMGGESMKHNKKTKQFFEKSRFLYFKKYYGTFVTICLNIVLSISSYTILLTVVLAIATFLSFYRLPDLMVFIGDQGWFYLSARDMVFNGTIPLVGIPSSHPWLSQGPLWTYILAFLFSISAFNPVVPGFFTAAFNVATVALIYHVGKQFFSRPAGLLAAFLYATSPLVIIHSRMPYHTSLIPFFTLLYFYCLSKFIVGKKWFFPLSLFLLSVLYNFEIAATILFLPLLFILGYGFIKKKYFIKQISNTRILFISLMSFLFPLIPILLYDTQNGYPHTFKFAAWLGYRGLKFFGMFPSSSDGSWTFFFEQTSTYIQRVIFLGNKEIALTMFVMVLIGTVIFIALDIRRKKVSAGEVLLGLWVGSFILGYILNKTPSEAYWPIFFPAFFLIIGFLVVRISKNWVLSFTLVLCVLLTGSSNVYSLISNNYLMGKEDGYGLAFSTREDVAGIIVDQAQNQPYALVGKGKGSEFDSFLDNYSYLTWYKGNGPSKNKENLVFTIWEDKSSVHIDIADQKK